jgi:hypothetical protein
MSSIQAQDTAERMVTVGYRELTVEQAEQVVRQCAGWFYWIAALSLINWVALALGQDFAMIIGLGITQVASGIAFFHDAGLADLHGVLVAGSLAVTLLAAAIFGLLGYFGRLGRLWAHGTGIVLYGLDTLIFTWAQDWLSVGFHLFVLAMLGGGISTMRALNEARAREVSLGALLRG